MVSKCLYSQIYYWDVYMLRIVYPICCGLDVHRSMVFACVALTNDKGITTYKSHRFNTFIKGLKELVECLN